MVLLGLTQQKMEEQLEENKHGVLLSGAKCVEHLHDNLRRRSVVYCGNGSDGYSDKCEALFLGENWDIGKVAITVGCH